MNIYITKEEHEFLLKHRNRSAEYRGKNQEMVVGSHLYGTNTEDSDKDVIYFYNSDIFYSMSTCHLPKKEQFIYDDKENNQQILWMTEYQFWKNLASGDSTINSDYVLFSGNLPEYQALNMCCTQKVIKAYLGFAKRDLKQWNRYNKLFHAIRGLYIAESLLMRKLPSKEIIKDHHRRYLRKTLKGELESLKNFYLNIYDQLKKDFIDQVNNGDLKLYFVPYISDQEHDPYLSLARKLYNANNKIEWKYDN